ncbi:long neurotoxin homolog TA-bm16-like [Sorex araneus]|uniref:long neurotoxin homolog TA-bm16-like n=1 Tax=Sorex araneus TaxID=42254 RepID=UPI0024338DCC|nr:long neurotoxin homolog TA-bm16-like [Sorex araneus]
MGRMKSAVLPLLLLALQCLDGVWALKCHNCSALADTCSNPEQCAPHMKACSLVRASATVQFNQKVTMVTKMCLPSCENPLPVQKKQGIIQELGAYVYCCTTDLCNGAPSPGLGATTVGMMLLVPVLATLLGDFL